jgi:hypothetical protein
MSYYVWCKNEDRRIPTFRCLLCRLDCYPNCRTGSEAASAFEILKNSGKYKERFVMKRKDNIARIQNDQLVESREESGLQEMETLDEKRVFLLEEGKLIPFATENYTSSILYQVVEAFSVECRLVRPEDPASLMYEGKRPAKKTVPIIITKSGDSMLLESWEELESKPEQLVDAVEVIGAVPVRQAFVLRRK